MSRSIAMSMALLCAGCSFGKIEADRVITGRPRAAHSASVAIFMEGQPLPGALEEIAIVQVVGSGNHAKLDEITDRLRAEARALGCTVVANVRFDRGVDTASATGVAGVPAAQPIPSAPPPPLAGPPASQPPPSGAAAMPAGQAPGGAGP